MRYYNENIYSRKYYPRRTYDPKFQETSIGPNTETTTAPNTGSTTAPNTETKSINTFQMEPAENQVTKPMTFPQSRALFDNEKKWKRRQYFIIIPGIIYILAAVIYYFLSLFNKTQTWSLFYNHKRYNH